MATEVKVNPMAFFKYAKSNIKTRTGINDLVTEDGITHATETEKVQVVSNFFSSVFTRGPWITTSV